MGKQEQNTGNSTLSPTESQTAQAGKKLNTLSTIFFYLAILFFIIGFSFTDVPPGPFWYQQFMPNLGNKQIQDVTFTDSLNGYASAYTSGDSSYILRTSDGGNNWQIIYRQLYYMTRLQFLNKDTGYAGGAYVYETTNGGLSWSILSNGLGVNAVDISVLNVNTIWFVESNPVVGGVYFTNNGGASWTQQYYMINQNPAKIYMFNARIGFASSTVGLLKTTNSGSNWLVVSNDFSFSDMFFIDSLTGWKAYGLVKKTTDGGASWVSQPLPTGNFLGQGALKFMNKDNDTIWAVGESMIIGGPSPYRGILYRTINGGNNWLYQVPDTSIHIVEYFFGEFVNRLNGWAYHYTQGGIHTTTGGDTTFLTGIRQISSQLPKDYSLFQNYPNPFNPITNIGYQLRVSSYVELSIYDISGKHIIDLVDQKQTPGTYNVDFAGNNLSSGVYFYRITIHSDKLVNGDRKEEYTATKKMLLIK